MTDSRGSQAEAEAAIERLLDKLSNWLIAQPELLILWTQPRSTRKRVAELLAHELMTIPKRMVDETTPPNRSVRRAILRELEKNGAYWEDAADFMGIGGAT